MNVLGRIRCLFRGHSNAQTGAIRYYVHANRTWYRAYRHICIRCHTRGVGVWNPIEGKNFRMEELD